MTMIEPADMSTGLEGMLQLAASLAAEGRHEDALLLSGHLESFPETRVAALRQSARVFGASGRPLDALSRLVRLKALCDDASLLIDDIRLQLPLAAEAFNQSVASGDVASAERLASAMAALVPGNAAMVEAAMNCNQSLGRMKEAASFADILLRTVPGHEGALAIRRIAGSGLHPLVRLRDLHDTASRILCALPDARGIESLRAIADEARSIAVDVPVESDLGGWLRHYRLAMQAIDPSLLAGPLPPQPAEESVRFMSGSGLELTWAGLSARAMRLEAQTVFFAAADRAYVDLYARWYIRSILKHSDVNCLVVVHVIGGAGMLAEIAASLGIDDDRLILAADAFDAAAVTTRCYDTPPKGLIEKPVAHLQSVRFLRVGALLMRLRLPVFVSDIDLLLQRGVSDLLERCRHDDVVFNENEASLNAGSRLTANLLLVNPTPAAQLFLRLLRNYLEQALSGPEVSRWIDQFGLVMARQRLRREAPRARIGYFDTSSDINNVMYRSYQSNPFRFLSLYHGFDTSSLEDVPAIAGSDLRPAA